MTKDTPTTVKEGLREILNQPILSRVTDNLIDTQDTDLKDEILLEEETQKVLEQVCKEDLLFLPLGVSVL